MKNPINIAAFNNSLTAMFIKLKDDTSKENDDIRIKNMAAKIHDLVENGFKLTHLHLLIKHGVPKEAVQYYKEHYLTDEYKLLELLQ